VPTNLLHLIGDFAGALILTYAVSRAGLILMSGLKQSTLRLGIVHVGSWVLLTALVGWIEWYSASAGWVYIVPQLLWFTIDKLRGR